MMSTPHTKDADCVRPTECAQDGSWVCPVCRVLHGEPCDDCGERAFHSSDCALGHEEAANILRDPEIMPTGTIHGYNERDERGHYLSIIDARDARIGELIGERDALANTLNRIISQPIGHTDADSGRDVAAMVRLAHQALAALDAR